jgi:hypothetical protein
MLRTSFPNLKIAKTSLPLTSFSGLPLLVELAHQWGLWESVNDIPGLQERERIHRPADYMISLVLMLAAGGNALDDVDVLRGDPGLRQILGGPLAAPNSLGPFLRKFDRSALYRLSLLSSALALESLRRKNLSEVTLDIDSTLIEANKELAHKTFKGFPGYNPLLAWIAEANVWISGVFREGNSSPQSHLLPLLKHCERLLPAGTKLRFRSDSAGYQIKLMKHFHTRGHLFTITADQDAAVRATIAAIPEKAWKIIETKKEVYALAETVHAPGHDKDLPAFRLIVKRVFTGRLELFQMPLEDHAIISNAPADWSMEQVLNFHNKRGIMEKAIGVLKNETGLANLPCGTLLANGAYFQAALLTYNLLQLFKLHALPIDWYRFGWTRLRYRLIGQAALVVKHARNLVLKLARDYVHYPVFERARWAVYGFAATG